MELERAILLLLPRLSEGDSLSQLLRSTHLNDAHPELENPRRDVALCVAAYSRKCGYYMVSALSYIEGGEWMELDPLERGISILRERYAGRESCGRGLGYLPAHETITALEEGKRGLRALAEPCSLSIGSISARLDSLSP